MSAHRLFAAALCCASGIAAAQSDDAGSQPIETITVIAHPLSAEGLALSSEILEGEDLAKKLGSSIGETVGYEPGVHSANFGQAASRPVIHGLSGPRVRIMEDRIDSLDVSVTSADHAVTIEPFIADRIEILKGPSTLLYGSGAIGGVVDVHTGRIPHERADRPLSGSGEVRRNDNGERETAALRLDGGAGSIAWHADAFSREADNYDIPGFAESRALRAQEEAEHGDEEGHDEDHDEEDHEDEVRGTLPGSALDVKGGAVGLSFVGDRGFIGASVSRLDAEYGLPGGHEHEEGEEGEEEHEEEHGEEEGNPLLDLKQTRVDFEAGLANPFRGFESMNVRIGYNDYEHEEIEPNGEVATLFENKAIETRIELTHAPLAGWRGAFGVQFQDRDFSAVGEEAFIAPVDTRSLGAFWVAERQFDNFELEAGARLEQVDIDPSEAGSQDFTGYAASLGIVIPAGEYWSVGLLADFSARAPIAEELFSNGPHLATSAFEIGNPNLNEEKAFSVSGNLRYAGDAWFFNGTLYYNRFSDFIFESPTGDEEDGLPVFVFLQEDADFFGFDAELRRTVATWDNGSLEASAMFDTVSAELDVSGNDKVPASSAHPLRCGSGRRLGPGAGVRRLSAGQGERQRGRLRVAH
ncbi:MAG: TonB-dependent receptor [Gammaproteobacteria bacterium]|nr:TonB-dependent receptor [Gammaproteobacteria bacterium]